VAKEEYGLIMTSEWSDTLAQLAFKYKAKGRKGAGKSLASKLQ
jgi:hypothetical protein